MLYSALWIASAWLAENGARIAAAAGLRILAECLFRKALALQKRLPAKPFMTADEYFRPYLTSLKRALIRHDIALVERDQDVISLTQDIIQRDSPLVVISAPPGQGKSRFALELARSVGRDRRTFLQKISFRGEKWKAYFANTAFTDLLPHIATLPRGELVALFFDDAPNSPHLARSVAQYVASNPQGKPLALVFTSRGYLLPTTLDALPAAFLGRVRLHKLNRLSTEGIGKIYDALLPRLSRSDKHRFVHLTKDSPFLTVLLCEALRSGVPLAAQLSDEQLRRQLCDEPIEKATSGTGVAIAKTLAALAGICALAPFDRRSPDLREAIKDLSGLNDAELDSVLQAAINSGLFIEYGASRIRPAPDLVGDLILDRVLVSDIGKAPSDIARRIIHDLLPLDPGAVLANMADLGWTKGDASVDLIAPVLNDYKSDAVTLDASALYALIERLGPIAARRPEAVLSIIEALWDRIRKIGPISDASMREWRRLLGATVPVLDGAAYSDKGLARSMVLAREFYKNAAADTEYDNHKPLHVLIEIAGFSAHRPLELTSSALSELERWFDGGGADAVVALESLDQLLSSTVNWTESNAGSMTFSSQNLSLNDKVIELRGRAVTLVERGILTNDPKIAVKALEMVDALGRYRSGPGYAVDSPLAHQIQGEKLRLADSIEKLLAAGAGHRVTREAEKRLWNWWCFSDDIVANRSAELLARIPSDPVYQISKALFGSDIPLETIVPSKEEVGARGRPEYFFKEGREEFSVENVASILARLGFDDSVATWAAFLRQMSIGENTLSWRASRVFEALARRAPAAGMALAIDFENEVWSNSAITLLSTIREVDRALWQLRLSTALANLDHLPERLKIAWLASLDWRRSLDEQQVLFVDKCIASGLPRVTLVIVDDLAHSSGLPWDESLRRLFEIAGGPLGDIRVLDQIFSKLVHGRRAAGLAVTLDAMDRAALEHLLALPAKNGVPWDKPHWVGPYLKLIAEHYPTEFFAFFKEALSKLSSESSSYFQILGARNAVEPIKALLDGRTATQHLANLFAIASEDNIAGTFVRAIFRNVLPIKDERLQKHVEQIISIGEVVKAAILLSGYRFSLDWLELCKNSLVSAENLSLEHFDEVSKILSPPFWEGETSRSLGQPTERDRDISLACARLSDDLSLPPRCRRFFEKEKNRADREIADDLRSDEELLGEPL
ncbi:MAG: hypothetical protein EPO23_14960 [Xanthobacteraceae bacterium]|nr:MAG: hypothetical protein EPO23_14960 [Xanthobacteraceae bacterium]